MFDIAPLELLLIVIVAVVVIGPKDLPLALRTAGRWIGKVRKVSGQFRAGLDAMIREAEMEEMEKKWREQNEKIMREHPAGGSAEMEPTGAYPSAASPSSSPSPAPDAATAPSPDPSTASTMHDPSPTLPSVSAEAGAAREAEQTTDPSGGKP